MVDWICGYRTIYTEKWLYLPAGLFDPTLQPRPHPINLLHEQLSAFSDCQILLHNLKSPKGSSYFQKVRPNLTPVLGARQALGSAHLPTGVQGPLHRCLPTESPGKAGLSVPVVTTPWEGKTESTPALWSIPSKDGLWPAEADSTTLTQVQMGEQNQVRLCALVFLSFTEHQDRVHLTGTQKGDVLPA